MPECETSPHGWTLDTLEEYLSQKIKALENLTASEQRNSKESVINALVAVKEQSSAAVNAAQKALDKAEMATEKRFDSVNEFRKTLADQAAGFLSRAEYFIAHKALDEKLGILQSRMDARDGQVSGVTGSWGFLIGLIGMVVGIVVAFGSVFAVLKH